MVYHARDTAGCSYAGRTTRAQSFGWNADNTPRFGTLVHSGAATG